ncbi:MAG TPA: murein biosynthesis integral membrane protein MurJ [Nocardioidaceae bacterium]|nr:murein biosynthesis integral membrane protein MurJ [Nocardioidaceae bacterium]
MTPGDRAGASSGILGSSAVMAAGTVVSRLSGFVRLALLAAALGNGLHADVFNIANTIPNMLYILLAGGVFNAVLVPQLVRAMKHDPDGGDGYTNRIITLAGVFLAGVTAVLVVLAPWLMRLFLTGCYFTPALAAQRDSAIDLARYCLPQVFFYGMFVLVGQVLNARGRFGPMMWAPIANNVISVGVLGAYLGVFGYAHDSAGAYTSHQELLLGIGSTLGIVAQFAILLPYMRAAGFTFRPRFDFRGYGLGHTLRLGLWTVLFVVVNQIAYTVVVRLASSGTAQAACGGGSAHGTGYTIYDQTFLLVMVPHSVATVSLATAVLPQLSAMAAGEDLTGVSRTLAGTLRTALVVIIPFALLLPVVALDLSHVLWGRGAARTTYPLYAPSLSLFAIVLVFFTTHYLMLRGFYAFERTRTVFWVQCAVAATNVALAVVFTRLASPVNTAPALVLAYAAAYLVGAVCSYSLLRRLLGGLETGSLARFLVRLVPAAGLAALAAWAVRTAVDAVWPTPQGWMEALVPLTAAGLVDVVVFLALARALRLTEVTDMLGLVTSRLRR